VRLEDLSCDDILRAVALYVELAWAEVEGEQTTMRYDVARLQGKVSLEELFAEFEEPGDGSGERTQERYTLRLGNSRYPFMKFVVQEYLVDKEYFFSVDTHDDFDVGEDHPDHEKWTALKRANRELKTRIEEGWHAAGLPTHEDLRVLAEGLAKLEREDGEKGRILVVDDEVDVARSVQALLEAKGYRVELAHDGVRVMEILGEGELPDLVLLDLGMPELDGEEVLRRMRADERLRELPVLLATASEIDLDAMPRVAGFLRKPYPREVLFAMLETLLAN
jgi:CheY-like chemotaxis protein